MFKPGDLVRVNKHAAIAAFAGATGIIVRNLGTDMTEVVTGESEYDTFYYEVNIAAQGTQIVLGRELDLLSKAERKSNENR